MSSKIRSNGFRKKQGGLVLPPSVASTDTALVAAKAAAVAASKKAVIQGNALKVDN